MPEESILPRHALHLILGERADSNVSKKQGGECTIEAIFFYSQLLAKLFL